MQESLHLITDRRLDELAERAARRAADLVVAHLTALQESAATPERLLTSEEARARLHVSTTTLWQMRRRGELVAVQVGRAVRFRASDVDAIAQGHVAVQATRKGP